MPKNEVRWWAVRRAHSDKPATYRCPLCDQLLHAMSDHLVIAPEGNANRRRHAHTTCVVAAREARTLLTYDDWRMEQPGSSSLLSRVVGWLSPARTL